MDQAYMRAVMAGARQSAGQQGIARMVNGEMVLPQASKKKGRGGFLSSLISEAGGATGAAGGMSLGAALGSVVPGIGTVIGGLVGAGIGGFTGGTAGRGIENKIRDDQNFLGAGGSARTAFGEGALSGVLSGLGTGVGAVRGLKAAGGLKGLSTAAGGSDDVLKGLSKQIVTGGKKAGMNIAGTQSNGILNRAGTGLTKYGSGITTDPMVGGINRADELAGFMSKYKGSPNKQLRLMDKDMTRLSGEIDTILTETPVKLKGTQVRTTLQRGFKDPTDALFADLDLANPTTQKYLKSYTSKFDRLGDAKSINDQLKTVQGLAVRARDKLGMGAMAPPLTPQETAALAIKRAADDVLGGVDSIAPLKKQMAQIFEANPMVTKASGKVLGAPMAGVKVPKVGQAIRGAASYAGGTMQGVGTRASASPLIRQAKIQAPGNLISALNEVQQPQDQASYDETGQMPEPTSFYDNASGALQGLDAPLEQPAQSMYSREAVMADIQRDPKNMATYIKLYEFANPEGSTKPLKKTQAQMSRDEAASLTQMAIDQLNGGSVNTGLVSGKVEGIKAMLGKGDPETIDFNTTISSLKAAIAKARAGTSFTPNEERLLNKYAPTVGDSGQQLRTKLAALQKVYAAAAQREYGTQAQEDPQDMVQALMQTQGGYY